MLLYHSTSVSTLPAILRDGKLSSRASRIHTTNKAAQYVYLTPSPEQPSESKHDVILCFNAESLMAEYPKFFINNMNAFGPLDGKKPAKESECGCFWTYNTMTDLEGPCVAKSYDEIVKHLTHDINNCDGGPEIGFPGEIHLRPHLTRILIPKNKYESIANDIPKGYEDVIIKPGGSRRRTIKTRKTRKTKTEQNI